MASTDKPDSESGRQVSTQPSSGGKCFGLGLTLRVLVLAACITAVVVMVTSKQTELAFVPGIPFRVPVPAKFSHSPAFSYFVSALSGAGLYSIIAILCSLSVMRKPCSTKVLFHLATGDVIMLGIVASATGAAGSIAYVGLKGNDHTRWMKICHVYDKFCRHVGSSIAVSLFAAVLLVFLCVLNICSLYKRIRH